MFSNQSIVIGVHPSSQLISFEILSRCCYIFEDLFVCFVKKLHISAKKVLQIITRIFSSNAFEFNRKMKKEKNPPLGKSKRVRTTKFQHFVSCTRDEVSKHERDCFLCLHQYMLQRKVVGNENFRRAPLKEVLCCSAKCICSTKNSAKDKVGTFSEFLTFFSL